MTHLSVKTLDGGTLALTPEMLANLRSRLRGQLVLPGEPGYDAARTLWNAMIDRRPALVVRALGTADVLATVTFAREHGLLMTFKGGGHNIAGLALENDALLLDLSAMRGVWVDPSAEIARAQAGCLLGDVDRETQLHGLAAVLGFVSATGIAGLTLGVRRGARVADEQRDDGLAVHVLSDPRRGRRQAHRRHERQLARRFGWTTDSVRSMRVVTADGRLVTASERENPDLFWGLRGGGGNFGVVTEIEYTLFPVGPEIVGGAIAWPAEDAPAVLEMFRAACAR